MLQFLKREKGFYRHLFQLALPMFLQYTLTCFLNLVDSFVVGTLGETALASITVANIPLRVIMLFSFGAQSGTSILVSQYWGKDDRKSIMKVLGVALISVVSVCAVFVAILYLFPYSFMSLFSNDSSVVSMSAGYAQIIVICFLLSSINNVYFSALAAMEKPTYGPSVLSVTAIIKIVLTFAFIKGRFGPFFAGINGAAYATLIVRVIELLCVLLHIRFNRFFRLDLRAVLNPGVDMFRKYFTSAGTVIFNETAWGAGVSMITNVMSHMPNSVLILSAYSIASSIETVTNAFQFSISNTAAIIVGKEVGANNDPKTIKEIGWAIPTVCAFIGVFFASILYLTGNVLGPDLIFPLFDLSAEATDICIMMIDILAILVPVKAFNDTIVVGVLRGGGDVQVATLIDLLPLWIGAVPYALFVGLVLKADIFFVMMSYAVQYLLQSVMAIRRLRSGEWIRNMTY